ncbi:MAG: TIGR01777 family oxidoreductase [Anaerolineae bacterium]|nr:TIGR01777 family oxidoreductase [Anaerolineae bacterium]
MRIIITGGTGQIGRTLAHELIFGGYEVVVLSRRPERVRGLAERVKVAPWDGRTAAGWGHLADGALAIVNLAGENLAGEGFLPARWTAERKQLIRESRLAAGRAVTEAVAQAQLKPRVVVQASGIGHYGNRGDEILTEASAPGTDFLARLTVEWEASTAGVTAAGVRHVSIRSGVVLSPTEGALARLLLPYRLFVGGPFGNGRQWFSWIHPADEVAAIRFLIEHPQAVGPFNLCAPQPLTNAEFGRVLGRVLGRPSWLPVPAFVLRLALGEVAGTVLEGQRAIPQKLLDLGFRFCFPDAESALRDLLGKSRT